MTNTRIHRFDFGALRDFRGPMIVEALRTLDQQEAPAAPPPPPIFTEADLEAARIAGKKEGYAEGFLAGERDAKQSIEQKARDAQEVLQHLGQQLSTLEYRYHTLLRDESQELSALVTAIAKKVAGEALDANGCDVILALVERCLPVIFSKPRLIIELNPEVFATTLDRIETLIREAGIEAEIQIRANDTLGKSDVKLDWGSGQMTRESATLWQEIEQIIAHVPLTPTFLQPQPTPQENQ